GALKVKSLEPQLKKFLDHENRDYAKTAMAALVAINPRIAEGLLKNLAAEHHPLDLRLLAVSQLAQLNATAAAKLGVGLLNKLDNPEQARGIFDAFLADGGRTNALAQVLVNTPIPEEVAIAARQHLQTAVPWDR